MSKTFVSIFLTALVVSTLIVAHAKDRHSGTREENMLATNECFAKGGIGIVSEDLYVDLKSAKNELVLGKGKRWTGQSSSEKQVVFVFEGAVWPVNSLPQNFDLSSAIIVSFEVGKVRFCDLSKMSGGYYTRQPKR